MRRLLSILVCVALTACLGDVQTTQQLCEKWQKAHQDDPQCGGGVNGGGSGGGTSGGGDPFEGKDCNAEDHQKLNADSVGIYPRLGNCYRPMFFIGGTCFLLGANCVAKCLSEMGSRPPCGACLSDGDARVCVKNECATWCDQNSDDDKCGECIKEKCAAHVTDCIPVP